MQEKVPAPVVEAQVFVLPRPGYILAGIPAAGTFVPKAQADEWKRMGLVVEGK
jgi:hypothetical protein